MERHPLIRSAAALILCALWPVAGLGHAFLESTEPKVGAELSVPPERIVLHFDSDLEPAFSSFRVEDASGSPVNSGKILVDPKSPKQLAMLYPPLSPGTYKVSWSVVSRDGHPTSGSYTFTIR